MVKRTILVKIVALKVGSEATIEIKLFVMGPASELVSWTRHVVEAAVIWTLVPAEVFEIEPMQVVCMVAVSVEAGKYVPVVVVD